jgi:two-component system sensor histidine kinase TorS
VGSAEQALDLISNHHFDVVLMDVNLPGMSGGEATRRLRQMPGPICEIPIVGVSAHVQPDEIAACRAAGMDDVIAKPLAPEMLVAALERLFPAASPIMPLGEILRDLGAERTRDLTQLMLERLPGETQALADALRVGAQGEIERRAHQLNGAVGNFALPRLAELLAKMSRKGAVHRPGDAEVLVTASAEAARDLERALEWLDAGADIKTAAQ